MTIIIEQVLSSDEVKAFRAKLEGAEWQDGARSAGNFARNVKHNQQLADASPLATELGNHILRKLGTTPKFISCALPHRIYPPKFNRYADGGGYGAHVDSAMMQIPGTNITVRSDLSATLFLSAPDSYEGGELQIESGDEVRTVKLKAGDMVLYSAGSLHQVTPVTKGERLASFFWIESLVGEASRRALLHDLDLAIQDLTRTVPADNRALVKLTGVYHNLLRQWSVA